MEMFSLSFKEMRFFKVRYLLISFILFFIAALVFIINGLANGLSMDNASSFKTMDAEAFFISSDAELRLDRSNIEIGKTQIESSSAKIQPAAIQMASLKGDDNQKLDVTFLAINPGSYLEPIAIEGEALNGNNSMVVDSSLKNEGLKIGDVLEDERTGAIFKVSGFAEHQTYSHTPVVFISLDFWSGLTNGKVSFLALQEKDQLIQDKITKAADGIWAEKEKVISGIPGYEAEQNSLFMMLSFLIVIAVFVLAAFFYIMTIQKKGQMGILKAIGAKTGFLIKSTLAQVLMLTVISIGAAIGFTWLAGLLLPPNIPFVFDIVQIIKYAAILCMVSLFGSLISSINIIKADPIQAMGRVE
ncbi:ABC transporter permease [Aeromicrobium ponti]|uniref:Putative hemin transport system permease protein HrtB n=2 Tax=Cytobacillus oceanisediminis TaxID=665099 RepID=A0A562JDW2_9BACI|nr:ABC transporter permease [Cytobacillus oceanisediminis]TWH81331.1 putative ABC transport system permease protein [Cytobacillus oceanisediminis]